MNSLLQEQYSKSKALLQLSTDSKLQYSKVQYSAVQYSKAQ